MISDNNTLYFCVCISCTCSIRISERPRNGNKTTGWKMKVVHGGSTSGALTGSRVPCVSGERPRPGSLGQRPSYPGAIQQAGQGHTVAGALGKIPTSTHPAYRLRWEWEGGRKQHLLSRHCRLGTGLHVWNPSAHPRGPRDAGALLPGLGSSSGHPTPGPGFSHCTPPSRARRKPEKTPDPDPSCNPLFSSIFRGNCPANTTVRLLP